MSFKNTKGTDWTASFSSPSPTPLISGIAGTIAATMESVAIFDSPGKGRGLKATKEFWAGDVIFSEPSLAAVVFDRYSNDGKCGGLIV